MSVSRSAIRRALALAFLLLTASVAGAAEQHPAVQRHAITLIETIAARHGLPLTGIWDVLVPQRVLDAETEGVAVAVTVYALRDSGHLRALLMVQRNVLPGESGWGAPAACNDGDTTQLTVYQSPRDVLCGWARSVSFAPGDHRAQMGPIVRASLSGDTTRLSAATKGWMWFGVRVSNRADFLDVQLLVPNQPPIEAATAQQFLADTAHSINDTWLTGALAATPPPPEAIPAPPVAGGPWWSGALSLAAMKTATYRGLVTVKTYIVTALMGANAVTGGAIVAILNVTSTAIYLGNDYIWETWRPLTPQPQNFASLVVPQ